MNTYQWIRLGILCLVAGPLHAQQLLTEQQVLDMALQRHPEMQAASLQVKQNQQLQKKRG